MGASGILINSHLLELYTKVLQQKKGKKISTHYSINPICYIYTVIDFLPIFLRNALKVMIYQLLIKSHTIHVYHII